MSSTCRKIGLVNIEPKIVNHASSYWFQSLYDLNYHINREHKQEAKF
jgi:hypothetical protein